MRFNTVLEAVTHAKTWAKSLGQTVYVVEYDEGRGVRSIGVVDQKYMDERLQVSDVVASEVQPDGAYSIHGI